MIAVNCRLTVEILQIEGAVVVLIRLHHSSHRCGLLLRVAYVPWSVSVCPVGHTREMAEHIEMHMGARPKDPCIRWECTWRHLVNMTE